MTQALTLINCNPRSGRQCTMSAHASRRRPNPLVPDLPCSARGALELELLLSLRSVDLAAVCSTIRSDIGLTVLILRASLQVSDLEPVRLCERVALLGRARLARMVRECSLHSFEDDADVRASVEVLWRHMYLTANAAEIISRHIEGVDPEESYLGGLLHDIGYLHSLLCQGWNSLAVPEQLGGILAQAWNLPPVIAEAIGGFRSASAYSKLNAVLRVAHRWSTAVNPDPGGEPGLGGCTSEAFISRCLPFLPRTAHSLLENRLRTLEARAGGFACYR